MWERITGSGLETVAQPWEEPRSFLFQLKASSIAAPQCQLGSTSKVSIKTRFKRVQSSFSMLLMNCKGYRHSRSHSSLPRGEIGSIYLLKKNPKGVFTREHSGDTEERASLLIQSLKLFLGLQLASWCWKINWGTLQFLSVYLCRNRYKSGSMQSSR